MASAYWPASSGGGGGITIGQPVTGGNPGSVVFEDASGNLAADPSFAYDSSSTTLTVGAITGDNWQINSDGSASFGGGALYWDNIGDLTSQNQITAADVVVQNQFSSDSGAISTNGSGVLSVQGIIIENSITSDGNQFFTDGSGNATMESLSVINSSSFDSGHILTDGNGGFYSQYLNVNGQGIFSAGVEINSSGLAVTGATNLDGGDITTSGTGKFSKYNNMLTAGQGIAPIIVDVSATTQNSSIGSTALLSNPVVSGIYRLNTNVVVTSAGVGGTLSSAVTYSAPGGSVTINPLSATNLSMGARGALSGTTILVISPTTAGTITYTTTYTVGTGSPSYNIYFVLERLA